MWKNEHFDGIWSMDGGWTPLPTTILWPHVTCFQLTGTDGNVLAADIVTNPAAILQASQMAQTYLTLQRRWTTIYGLIEKCVV